MLHVLIVANNGAGSSMLSTVSEVPTKKVLPSETGVISYSGIQEQRSNVASRPSLTPRCSNAEGDPFGNLAKEAPGFSSGDMRDPWW